MKTKIEIKSALLGLSVGVAATLAIGASSSSSATIGRYQVAGAASHGLVIDTATGQVWSKYLPQQSGSTDPDFERSKIGNKK